MLKASKHEGCLETRFPFLTILIINCPVKEFCVAAWKDLSGKGLWAGAGDSNRKIKTSSPVKDGLGESGGVNTKLLRRA